MPTFAVQPLAPSLGSISALPAGAGSIAIAAVIVGLMLVTYAVRRRLMRRAPLPAPGIAEDLTELTDRLATEMDRRAARLEVLIAEADRRLMALDRAARSVPSGASIAEPKPTHSAASLDPSFAEIYRLADEGQSPVEIAQRTARPTGQIELILNLRRGNVAI